MNRRAAPRTIPPGPGTTPEAGRRPRRAAGGRRWLAGLGLAAAAALALGGCAAMNSIDAEISTYGEWPAGRAPGSYRFDRLPSQQARPDETARLEVAAQAALAAAGFVPVAAGSEPDVLVQVAARVTRTGIDLWTDPLWLRGGWMPYRGPWIGPVPWTSMRMDSYRYEREVALLLRDRTSGKPLYEARAANEGATGASDETLEALFRGAMTDFPRTGPNPRPVTVTLP